MAMSAIRRKKATEDLYFFGRYYLPHYLSVNTPSFHYEIYSLLLKELRLGIAAPRSFAKSTIVQIVYGLWCLLCKRNEDILTISQSGMLSQEWIRKLKIELETNIKIYEDFGDLLIFGPEKSTKWTEDHITINDVNGKIVNQIRAKGRGYQVRGFRPTRVFCDDLEDDELVRSSEQRAKLSDWFKKALVNMLTSSGQIVFIGTILHPLALLKEVIDRREEFMFWTTRKFQAIENDKSIWQERWPMNELLRRKQEIGIYAFQAEFMNEPMASDSVLFRPEWIKRTTLPPPTVFRIITVDPATSEKESADESAIFVLGLTKEGDLYELESISGRWNLWDMVDNIINMYCKWKAHEIGLEKVAFQSVLKPVVIKRGQERGLVSLPVKSITVGMFKTGEKREAKDKWTRAYKVTHFFENGRVYLKNQKLIDQMIVFPTGDHDDLVDAMVYALLLVDHYGKGGKVFKNKDFSLNQAPFDTSPLLLPPAGSQYDWRTAI